MVDVTWRYWPHQRQVIEDTTSPAIALISGYRGGKTFTLARWAVDRAVMNPPGCVVLLVAPTWMMARRVIVPEVTKALDTLGLRYDVNKSDLTFQFAGRSIWMASGDKPTTLSGTTVACAGIDEPAIQDEEVDRRMVSRVSDPRATVRQILYTGTHEGLGWFYKRTSSIKSITVPSFANRSLNKDTVDRLRDRFRGDDVRFRMYVLGEAVALTGGIYTCLTEDNVRPCGNPKDGEITVGLDFNVGFMCTPIARVIDDEVHVLSEVISRDSTTEAHIDRVVSRLKELGLAAQRVGQFGREIVGPNGKRIDAWLDSSSSARKTSATRTDRAIVKDAGFFPRAPSANPLVRDRIETVQHALSHRRLFFDKTGAPFVLRAFREHAYNKATDPPEPQKRWREDEEPLDAATDAVGYLVCGVAGVNRRSAFRAA